MRIQIDNYDVFDKNLSVALDSTENTNLVNIIFEGKEITVSIDDLLAASIALHKLKTIENNSNE